MLTVTEIIVGVDGNPLVRGTLYVGAPGATNAQADQVDAYWDEAGEIPATQPITIRNGRPWRNNAPALVYTDDDYSITALDRTGSRVYHRARSPIAMAGIGSAQPSDPALTAISNLALDTTPRIPALTLTGETTAATGLRVGVDLQAYAAQLEAVRAGLAVADTAGPVDTETGLPTRKPGFIRYNLDGSTVVTEDFLSGIAYQTWVTDQITAATEGLGNNSLPANVLTMAQASMLYLPINNVLPLLPRHLRYEVYHNFPQGGTSGTFAPLSFSAYNSGTCTASTPSAAYPGAPMIQSSTTANSGGRVSSLRTGTVLTTGSIVDIRWRVLNPTNTTMFVGWTDANTITPTAMAAVAISGTSATPRILHSGTTTNGTGFTVAADTPYSTIVEVLSSSAARILTTNLSTGAVLSDVTVSATIPTAAVGGMLFASNSGTTATDLAVIHDFGMSPRGIGAA